MYRIKTVSIRPYANSKKLCNDLFFFNDTATTEIYTLSLHDALPISAGIAARRSARTAREKFAAHCTARNAWHGLCPVRRSLAQGTRIRLRLRRARQIRAPRWDSDSFRALARCTTANTSKG